jgi:hypothetical protein
MPVLFKRILTALLVMFALAATPALAQATRTWVSGVGDDANPCSRTAPCKTFAGAISKTAATGEINVLDPGGFGAVTITKAITIRSDHVQAGILVSGTNGIIINAPAADRVVLIGLDIEGIGTGFNGVNVISAGEVLIQNCTIHNFQSGGLGVGVLVNSTTASHVTIDHSMLNFNSIGVSVTSAPGMGHVSINDSLLNDNVNIGIRVQGAGNDVTILRNEIVGSAAALLIKVGAAVISYGQNLLPPGSTAPTTTLPLQ